jgi:hypothetical protein
VVLRRRAVVPPALRKKRLRRRAGRRPAVLLLLDDSCPVVAIVGWVDHLGGSGYGPAVRSVYFDFVSSCRTKLPSVAVPSHFQAHAVSPSMKVIFPFEVGDS